MPARLLSPQPMPGAAAAHHGAGSPSLPTSSQSGGAVPNVFSGPMSSLPQSVSPMPSRLPPGPAVAAADLQHLPDSTGGMYMESDRGSTAVGFAASEVHTPMLLSPRLTGAQRGSGNLPHTFAFHSVVGGGEASASLAAVGSCGDTMQGQQPLPPVSPAPQFGLPPGPASAAADNAVLQGTSLGEQQHGRSAMDVSGPAHDDSVSSQGLPLALGAPATPTPASQFPFGGGGRPSLSSSPPPSTSSPFAPLTPTPMAADSNHGAGIFGPAALTRTLSSSDLPHHERAE